MKGVGDVRNVTIHQLIWSHRNKTRLQEQSLPLNSIREAVCKYLQRFNSCRDKPRTIKQIRRRRWQPPKPGEYKINFDGAMFSEEDEAGLGIVVWDSAGQVLASLAEKIKKTTFGGVLGEDSSEMGCDKAKEIGLQPSHFEGDSETTIKALHRVLCYFHLLVT